MHFEAMDRSGYQPTVYDERISLGLEPYLCQEEVEAPRAGTRGLSSLRIDQPLEPLREKLDLGETFLLVQLRTQR